MARNCLFQGGVLHLLCSTSGTSLSYCLCLKSHARSLQFLSSCTEPFCLAMSIKAPGRHCLLRLILFQPYPMLFFFLLCGSLALCSLAVVIIHVPLAYETLCWFSYFLVAMFHMLFLSSSQSLNVCTYVIWTPAQNQLQNFCAAISVNSGCIWAWLVLGVNCSRWGQWRSQSRLCRNWGFQKPHCV